MDKVFSEILEKVVNKKGTDVIKLAMFCFEVKYINQ
jgi:hypothetical protein